MKPIERLDHGKWTKERRKIRSKYWHHMKPHVFDKAIKMIPYFLLGASYE
jgi:hypothetical protein